MRKIITGLLAVAFVGGIVAYFMYNKPHEDINKSKADITISAEQLFSDYENDETSANGKYLDKLIDVTGTVTSVSKNDVGMPQITLSSGDDLSGVICELDELTEHLRTEFKEGEKVRFKGKCSGMLMDVVLVRCVEIR